jgi:hypothetical protein
MPSALLVDLLEKRVILLPPASHCSTTGILLVDLQQYRLLLRIFAHGAVLPFRAVLERALTECRRAGIPSVVAGVALARPDLIFDRHLRALLSRRVALLSLLAWASSLGGGHYLCSHFAEAIFLARVTMVLSADVDRLLVVKSRLHFVYLFADSAIRRFAQARRVLRSCSRLLRDPSWEQDRAKLKQMLDAAALFLRNQREQHRADIGSATAPLVDDQSN